MSMFTPSGFGLVSLSGRVCRQRLGFAALLSLSLGLSACSTVSTPAIKAAEQAALSAQGTLNQATSARTPASYIVGAGIADSTGEVAENNMFGYADSSQVASGLQQRLHARAFTITDPSTQRSVLLVVVDTGMISQAIHQAVLRGLAQKYGERFTAQNVMITATHTHSASGGYSQYALYGITTQGFQKATFDAVVGGILRATDRAVASQAPATIAFGRSQLTNAGVNRSMPAFLANPAAERALFPQGIDPDMAVLRFMRGGQTFAATTFFATHPTSLTSKNTLVSGDNKGYAQYYWEKLRGNMDYRTGKGLIAAFANTNPGDISPNLNLRPGSGPTEDQWENARIVGERQAVAAINTPMSLEVSGPLDYRQKYLDMSRQTVRGEFTPDGKTHTTCPAAYKSAFAAGSSEDGGGGEGLGVKEAQSNGWIAALGTLIFMPSPELIRCQGNTEVTVPMGITKPHPMSPEVLPLQVVRLGNLALIAMPGEYSVVSGYRIRQTVAERLGLPLSQVIFMGFTNAYNGYTTTPEEYATQNYEGASTHFGPYSHSAWQQAAAELADALREGKPVLNTLTPRDLSANQISLRAGVVADKVPLGKKFGDVEVQPKASYARGQTASAVFWSGHPKNNLRTEDTFLEVQQLIGDQWKTVRDDSDWDTIYRWKRNWTDQSLVTIEWDIGDDVPAGIYRLVHHGDAKNFLTQRVSSFTGISRAFVVE